ncbi:hypothetical protein GCM10017557_41220 [Streptomyces aurantiacus]|uniref:Uncharacterized protein n=1 Tax=Streptomyces aurantiacus TaxID=47760 RepID=A0A7G1P0H7_9ACTN|nr:hypothetical protein GCM10017557_41220 [Streptomyces aurantiacus]
MHEHHRGLRGIAPLGDTQLDSARTHPALARALKGHLSSTRRRTSPNPPSATVSSSGGTIAEAAAGTTAEAAAEAAAKAIAETGAEVMPPSVPSRLPYASAT